MIRSSRTAYVEEELDRLKRHQRWERDSKHWADARDFLLERRMMKQFIMWQARREDVSAFALQALDAALDHIHYPEPAMLPAPRSE